MFIIEADTPDELRLKLIRILANNAERCDRNANNVATVKLREHFKSQAIAFRLMATDLKDTEIRPKTTTPYDPSAEQIQNQRAELDRIKLRAAIATRKDKS